MPVKKTAAKKTHSKAPRKPRETKLKKETTLTAPTPWMGTEKLLDDHVGFVYRITHKPTGKAYIGRKYMKSHTRVKVKGRTNRKRKVSDSNWRHYKSSCQELKDQIKEEGLDKFLFEIVSFHTTRRAVNYAELEMQVKCDVLTAKLPDGSDAYYNANILSRYFKEKDNEQTAQDN